MPQGAVGSGLLRHFTVVVSFEPSFQDHRGRRRIDLLARHATPASPLARTAAQPLLGVLRGASFVDQVDRQSAAEAELGGESACGSVRGLTEPSAL